MTSKSEPKKLTSAKSIRSKLIYPINYNVAGYTIVKHLSVGKGMANVYLAEQREDNGVIFKWVIKQIIDPAVMKGRISDKEYKSAQREVEALETETSVMHALKNMPQIPRIVNSVKDKRYHSKLLIMDYVEGFTIEQYIYKGGKANPVPVDLAVTWAKDIAGIFSRLHNLKQPVVYRDCKPSNIMITNNQAYLIDFGTAEMISYPGATPRRGMGTDGYASPEQKKSSNPIDIRSDIYGLGVTLYHMVTGYTPKLCIEINGKRTPLQTDTAPFTVERLGLGNRVPVGLNDIIIKCTQPNPKDRYQSMEELIVDLKSYRKKDVEYRRKQRKKLNTFYTVLGSSAICFIGSLMFSGLSTIESQTEYSNAVIVAQQSGKSSDFFTAIAMNPTDTNPYEGLFESIKQDGVFTPEEETQLLNIINPNLTKLREQKEYPKLSYELGRLYWFYYQSGGTAQSSKWFKDAKDMGYDPDGLSSIYFNISNFDKNIASYIKDSTDAGMYKDYWDNLNSALNTEHSTLVKLYMYDSLAKTIDTYSYKLKSDGVSKEDIDNVVEDMGAFVKSNTPNNDNEEIYFSSIESIYPNLKDKVNEAYTESEYIGRSK